MGYWPDESGGWVSPTMGLIPLLGLDLLWLTLLPTWVTPFCRNLFAFSLIAVSRLGSSLQHVSRSFLDTTITVVSVDALAVVTYVLPEELE